MPIKEALRTCKCRYCSKQFTMFVNECGELIFFPDNTIRPAWGYYELLNHVRWVHPEIYALYSLGRDFGKNNVEECYAIS